MRYLANRLPARSPFLCMSDLGLRCLRKMREACRPENGMLARLAKADSRCAETRRSSCAIPGSHLQISSRSVAVGAGHTGSCLVLLAVGAIGALAARLVFSTSVDSRLCIGEGHENARVPEAHYYTSSGSNQP